MKGLCVKIYRGRNTKLKIKSYDRLYVESKKKWYKWTYLQDINRITDVENKLMVTGGKGRKDKLGDWDWNIHTTLYKIDN